jgi:hypothetical protein
MHVLATYICIQLCSSRVHAVAILYAKAMIIAIESAESFPTRPVVRPPMELQELPSFCFIAFRCTEEP